MSAPPLSLTASLSHLHARLNALDDAIGESRNRVDALSLHVSDVESLVDKAALSHAGWFERLASMLESDTQRSAAVARKQEHLAASLGIRSRGTSYRFWRFCSHVALFVGSVFSLVFISPVSVIWKWKERRRLR